MNNQLVRGITNYALIGFAVFGASYTAGKLGIPKAVNYTAMGAAAVALYNNKHFEKALFGDVELNADPAPVEEEEAEVRDLTADDITAIKASVGGEEAFTNLIAFTKEHAPQEAIDTYDEIVGTGDPEEIINVLRAFETARNNILKSEAATPDTVGELIVRNDHGVV